MSEQVDIKIHNWVVNLQKQGKYSFLFAFIQEKLSGFSAIAIKSSLSHLSKKDLIISINQGYYLIIPPQYKSKGILPPALYLNAFMKELNRPYYLALLNEAAYHSDSHQ